MLPVIRAIINAMVLVRLQTKLDTLGWNLKETFEL